MRRMWFKINDSTIYFSKLNIYNPNNFNIKLLHDVITYKSRRTIKIANNIFKTGMQGEGAHKHQILYWDNSIHDNLVNNEWIRGNNNRVNVITYTTTPPYSNNKAQAALYHKSGKVSTKGKMKDQYFTIVSMDKKEFNKLKPANDTSYLKEPQFLIKKQLNLACFFKILTTCNHSIILKKKGFEIVTFKSLKENFELSNDKIIKHDQQELKFLFGKLFKDLEKFKILGGTKEIKDVKGNTLFWCYELNYDHYLYTLKDTKHLEHEQNKNTIEKIYATGSLIANKFEVNLDYKSEYPKKHKTNDNSTDDTNPEL